jgi:hypothetical protein
MMPASRNDRGRLRSAGASSATQIRLGLLSPYPSTRSGPATVTAGLRDGVVASDPGMDAGVVRLVAEVA